MRTLTLLAVSISLAACASAPPGNIFVSDEPVAGGTAALDCFVDQADNLGYVSPSRTGGEVRVERTNDEPFWLNMIGFNDSVDVLIADTQGNPPRLRVGAYSLILRGENRESAAPSPDSRREAMTILDACDP